MERTVLYAEDDPNDVILMQLVVARAGEDIRLQAVRDGRQAVLYLKREERFGDPRTSPAPALILLDVKMPKLSGLEVLAWIRAQAAFAETPAVMISSSLQESDVLQAYKLGANAYIAKPSAFKHFEETVSRALRFFLLLVNCPPGRKRA